MNAKTPIKIICPDHGIFTQNPYVHLLGHGCPICGYENNAKKRTYTNEDFLSLIKDKGINNISFLSEYIGNKVKIHCKCNTCGTEWFAVPNSILRGSACPQCNHLGGKEELKLFEQLSRDFPKLTIIHSYHNKELLGKQEYDIYFPELKIAIEYQGALHFENVPFFTSAATLSETEERDIKKNRISFENGIKLLYFIPSSFFKKTQNALYSKSNSFTNYNDLYSFIKKQAEKEAKKAKKNQQ